MSDDPKLLHCTQFERIDYYCKINWGDMYSYELVYETNDAGAAVVAVREIQMLPNHALLKMRPCFGLDAAWDKLEEFLREQAEKMLAMRRDNASYRSELEQAQRQGAQRDTWDKKTRFK